MPIDLEQMDWLYVVGLAAVRLYSAPGASHSIHVSSGSGAYERYLVTSRPYDLDRYVPDRRDLDCRYLDRPRCHRSPRIC